MFTPNCFWNAFSVCKAVQHHITVLSTTSPAVASFPVLHFVNQHASQVGCLWGGSHLLRHAEGSASSAASVRRCSPCLSCSRLSCSIQSRRPSRN